MLNNWCFWTVVLEKTLESFLDCKEIKPVNPNWNQLWIFIERTDAEAEAPILWPPDAKGWLTGRDPDAGKDWRQKQKGTTEDEMVRWHHWLNGHESGWWWKMGKCGVLHSMGSQRVRHYWKTEEQQQLYKIFCAFDSLTLCLPTHKNSQLYTYSQKSLWSQRKLGTSILNLAG